LVLDRSSVLLCPPPKNRARRARTYFDDRSIQILEHAFLQDQYPDIHRREQLSNEIGTSEARVQVKAKKYSQMKIENFYCSGLVSK
jgi:NADH:ubiquinone oxidoreductase subunit E